MDQVCYLNLHFSCRNLDDIIETSIPTTQVHVQCKDTQPVIDEYTDIFLNSFDPEYLKPILLKFIFESPQTLEITILNTSSTTPETLEVVQTTLADIVGSVGQSLTIPLTSKFKDSKAQLIIQAKRPKNSHIQANIELLGSQLRTQKRGCLNIFSKPNTFLTFNCKNEYNEQFEERYRTNVVKKSQNPKWSDIDIPLSLLCNGNKETKFRIDCFEQEGKEALYLGSATTHFSQLEKGEKLTLFDEKTKKVGGYLNSGYIATTNDFDIVDYIFSGDHLNVYVAIDFTSSNKPYDDPQSLHFHSGDKKSKYEVIFTSISQRLLQFTYDKKIHGLGFGAHFEKSSHWYTENCFPLDSTSFDLRNVDGLTESYYKAMKNVKSKDKRYFGDLLKFVKHEIGLFGSNVYNVLLIFTNGEHLDVEETCFYLKEMLYSPISIFVIGIDEKNIKKLELFNLSMDKIDDERKIKKHKFFNVGKDYVEKNEVNLSKLNKDIMSALGQNFVEYRLSKNLLPDVYLSMKNIK